MGKWLLSYNVKIKRKSKATLLSLSKQFLTDDNTESLDLSPSPINLLL